MPREILHPVREMTEASSLNSRVPIRVARYPKPFGHSTMPFRNVGLVLFGLLATGCSLSTPSADPSAYAAMNCNELNASVATVSNNISRTAITRGSVIQTDVPNWVPGGKRVATAVVERQTARIEGMQEQERAMVSARSGACSR